MKKLIAVIAALTVFAGAAFAQEEVEQPQENGFLSHLRLEAGIPVNLIPLGFGIETSAAYEFDINDSLMWDAGVGISVDPLLGIFATSTIGRSLNVMAFASFWWKALYVRYGLGLGVNFDVAKAGFVPLDLRIGWQPQFWGGSKSGVSFKLEGGIFGMTGIDMESEESDAATFVACFSINAGVSYRF